MKDTISKYDKIIHVLLLHVFQTIPQFRILMKPKIQL